MGVGWALSATVLGSASSGTEPREGWERGMKNSSSRLPELEQQVEDLGKRNF